MSVAFRRDARSGSVPCVLAVALTLAATGTVSAQSGAAMALEQARVDALMNRFVGPNEPGAAVVVSRGDSVVFAAGYGVADVTTSARITPATAFRLASVSKQMTAAAILTLVDSGRLRLDARLDALLAAIPPYARAITVRQLLAHTSGIPDYEPLLGAGDGPQVKDRDVLALMRRATTLYFEPGTSWRYSNTGYALLALIVEAVSGDSFASYLRRHLFDRAGMSTAVAHEEGADTVAERAYGHSRDATATGWRKTDQNRTSAVLGDGGIYASGLDLARWSTALDGNAVLSAAMVREATTPVTLPSGVSTAYGYGWFVDTHRGHRRQRHEGDSIGFRTAIQRYPDDKLTVIILMNRAAAPVIALSDAIADVFLSP